MLENIINLNPIVKTIADIISPANDPNKEEKAAEKKDKTSEDDYCEFIPEELKDDIEKTVTTAKEVAGAVSDVVDEVIKTAAYHFFPVVQIIEDIFGDGEDDKKDEKLDHGAFESQDGVITGSSQGATGDCWLLSGVNALSYTEAGADIIKDALEYQEDGTMVHFKYAGDYFVSNSTIEALKKNVPDFYSNGDIDMLVLEYAAILAKEDLLNNGNITYDTQNFTDLDTVNSMEGRFYHHDYDLLVTEGGRPEEMMYLLTGKVGETTTTPMEKMVVTEYFEQNGNKDFALTCASRDDMTLKNSKGEDVQFYGQHSYAVKRIEGDSVILVNPWNSDEEIEVTKESFASIPELTYVDLSNKTKEKDIILSAKIETVENEDGSTTTYKIDEKGRVVREEKVDANGKTVYLAYSEYDAQGAKTEVKHVYDDEGNAVLEGIMIFDDAMGSRPLYATTNNLIYGEVISEIYYSYDKDGALVNVFMTKYEYDDKGNLVPVNTVFAYEDGKLVEKSN